MAEAKLVLKSGDEAIIRMYGQGFGDCFLLAFPRRKENGDFDLNDPVYVVIDSGVFFLTPGDRKRMNTVARSIREATGGTIDLLVATHEHHDHLCGFEYAKEEWKKIAVRRIWVAWTENPNHPKTQEYDRERETLERQALAAQKKLAERKKKKQSDPGLDDELDAALALASFGLGRSDSARSKDNEFLAELALVLGEAPDSVSVLSNAIFADIATHPEKRFKTVANEPTKVDCCEPGEVRTVPATAVDAYVLGPPTDANFLGTDLIESEVYSEDEDNALAPGLGAAASLDRVRLGMAGVRAQRLSINAAITGNPDDDPYRPFNKSAQVISADEAEKHDFFKEYYYRSEPRRQIENEWLRGAGSLALQLDNLTNNTSLVLAFRLPDERVLLFVGDAQVGNWLSWDTIKASDWKRPGGGAVDYRPTAQELLAKAAVYKVGHHGSHNATLKAKGLERMPDGVIALVPSSRNYPQVQNNWHIPLIPLMTALKTKTRGRIVLPHDNPEYTNADFKVQVEVSTESFDPMQRENKPVIEDGVPVWRQLRL